MYWFDDEKIKALAQSSDIHDLYKQRERFWDTHQQLQSNFTVSGKYFVHRGNPFSFVRKKDLLEMKKCMVKQSPKSFDTMIDDEKIGLYGLFLDQVYNEVCFQNRSFLQQYETYLNQFSETVKQQLAHFLSSVVHANVQRVDDSRDRYRMPKKSAESLEIFSIEFVKTNAPDRFDYRKGRVVVFLFGHSQKNDISHQRMINQNQLQLFEQVIDKSINLVVQQMIADGYSPEQAKHVFHY